MRLNTYLQEARRNPEKNPKSDIISDLEPYKNKKAYFIHFATIPKIGIYPKTYHKTPIGIYAYPLREMWQSLVDNNIPYMGDAPYVFLFKFTGKYLDVEKYTQSQYNSDIKKLKKIFAERYKDDLTINKSFEDIVSDAEKSAYHPDEPISKIFNVTRILANSLKTSSGTSRITKWSKLLQGLGYDAVIDWKGKGVIHRNEPYQAVFFDVRKIQVIEMFENKREKPPVRIIKTLKEFSDYLKNKYTDYDDVVSLLYGDETFDYKDKIFYKLVTKLVKKFDDLILTTAKNVSDIDMLHIMISSLHDKIDKINDKLFEDIIHIIKMKSKNQLSVYDILIAHFGDKKNIIEKVFF